MTEGGEGGPDQRGQTRALAEGALLAALTVVLVLVVNLVPPLLILSLVAPVPLVIAVVRNGPRVGLLAGAVTAVLMGTFFGAQAILGGLVLAATGLGLGYGLRKGWTIEAALGLGTVVTLGSMVVSLWVSLQLAGVDLIDLMLTGTRESYEHSLVLWQQIYGRLGTNVDTAPIEAELGRAIEMLPLLVPGILVAAALAATFANYSASKAILSRLGTRVPAVPPFARWQLPTAAAYALVITFFAIRGAEQLNGQISTTLQTALMSAAWLLQAAVMVNGLATAYFFLRRWRLAKAFTVVILLVGFLNPWFQALFFWLGFMEPLLKVRNRFDRPGNGSGGEGHEGNLAD